MNTTTEEYAEVEAAISALGLTYVAQFVPFSKSRNAKPVKSIGDLSLNWSITLSKGRRSLTTDYSQGVAHVPGYRQTFGNNGLTMNEESAIKSACETGKIAPLRRSLMPKPIPAPLLRDVLYALSMDASVLDAGTFEEWAADLGYDTDSRQAEKIYRQCLDIALALRNMIGEAGLETLRQAFQDY